MADLKPHVTITLGRLVLKKILLYPNYPQFLFRLIIWSTFTCSHHRQSIKNQMSKSLSVNFKSHVNFALGRLILIALVLLILIVNLALSILPIVFIYLDCIDYSCMFKSSSVNLHSYNPWSLSIKNQILLFAHYP